MKSTPTMNDYIAKACTEKIDTRSRVQKYLDHARESVSARIVRTSVQKKIK